MKKALVLLTALALVLSLSAIVFCADAVPSISNKLSPEVVEQQGEGDPYVSEIITEEGDVVYVGATDFALIPLAHKDENNENLTVKMNDLVQATLQTAFNKLTSDKDLGKVGLGLNEVAKSINPDYNASVLVVSDLFEVAFADATDASMVLACKNGASVKLKMDLNLTDDDITPVLLFLKTDLSDYVVSGDDDAYAFAAADGWSVLTNVVRNDDNTLTVEVPGIGALAVLKVNPDNLVPGTSDTNNVLMIAVIALVVSALGVVAVVRMKKSH